MDWELAVAALSALAQSIRLEVFRLLMRNEPTGLPAGEIAKLLGVPHNTMSTHLNILSRTGLVTSERDGRSIVYRVDLEVVRGFFVYLLKDCCDGRPELCQPLLDDLTPCCQPAGVPSVSQPKRGLETRDQSPDQALAHSGENLPSPQPSARGWCVRPPPF